MFHEAPAVKSHYAVEGLLVQPKIRCYNPRYGSFSLKNRRLPPNAQPNHELGSTSSCV